jgi:hypothetical protein
MMSFDFIVASVIISQARTETRHCTYGNQRPRSIDSTYGTASTFDDLTWEDLVLS